MFYACESVPHRTRHSANGLIWINTGAERADPLMNTHDPQMSPRFMNTHDLEMVPVSGNFVPNLVMIVMNDFPYLSKVTIPGKFDSYCRRPFPARATA